jgi:hypothetical protein
MMDLLRKVFFLICISSAMNMSSLAIGADHSNFNFGNSIQSQMFSQNRLSLQVLSGAHFSPVGIGPETRDFDYWQTNLRLGWMLNNPYQTQSFLRGNFEALFEVNNALIYKGFGNYIGGITGLIRYNFLPPDSKLVAYIQGGIGVVYTDAYKDYSQRAIGQAIEFTPQGGIGFHYLINKNWSIDGEAMFHHISNAGLSDRNGGTNAIGAFVGVTCYFDSLFPSKLFAGQADEALPHEKAWPANGNEEELVSREAAELSREESSPKSENSILREKPLEFLQFLVEREGNIGKASSTEKVEAPAPALVAEKLPEEGLGRRASKNAPLLKGDLGKPTAIAGRERKDYLKLKGIEWKTSAGELRVVALADAPVKKYKVFLLNRPSRLVIDMPGKWRRPEQSALEVKSAPVKRVRVGIYPDKLRLVMDVTDKEPTFTSISESAKGLAISFRNMAPPSNRVNIAPILLLAKRSERLTLAAR